MNRNRLLTCLLAISLLLTSFSTGFVSACPEINILTYNGFEYEVETDYDDDYNVYQYICIINYTGNDKNVEIPSEIDGLPVKAVGSMAFIDNQNITSVTVPASVATVDSNAFEGCTNLSEINLPSTLTFIGWDILLDTAYAAENYEDGVLYAGQYLISSDSSTIGESVTVKEGTTLIATGAFFNSTVKSLTLPDSLKIINSNAFSTCCSLTSVTIPEGVENIEYGAFYSCSSLKEVSLPSTLKTIGSNCFADCTSLTSLDVPESVTDLPNGMLFGCSAVTAFEIKDTVTSIGSSVFDGTGIKSLHIPASVNYIMSIYNCPELETITVDSNNKWYFAENNVLFEKSFIDGSIRIIRIPCNKDLESYVVPDNVKTISYGALTGNTTLKNLTLGKNISAVYDFDAPCLENIYVHPENTTYSSADGVLLSNNGTTLEFYPMGKTCAQYTVPSDVTTLNSLCFIDNPYLTELTIPDTVKELNHTVVEACENLTTINMSPCEASFFWPFLFCEKLTTVNFSGTVEELKQMNIELYHEENNEGIYAYCSDGIVELEAPDYEYEYELGDVNMDQKLNIRDATAIQKHLAKISSLSEEAFFFADYNMDGKVSIQDATDIQKWLAWL